MLTLKEFTEKYLGKKVEYHSYGTGSQNQCVDLINAYINECLDNNTKDYTEIIGTDAKDFKDKFDPEDFDFIVNTKTPNVIPEVGDIPVWNGHVGGGAGHVAIVEEADGMKFISLDQNWSQVEKVTLEEHSYTNVSGWLRPKCSLLEHSQEPVNEHSGCIPVDEHIKVKGDLNDLKKRLEESKEEHADFFKNAIEQAKQVNESLSHIGGIITANKKELSEVRVDRDKAKEEVVVGKEEKDEIRGKFEANLTTLGELQEKHLELQDKYSEEKSKRKLKDFSSWDLRKEIFRRIIRK